MTLRDGIWSNAAQRLGPLVDRFNGRLPSEDRTAGREL
jgi:hypothetical protein